MGDQDSISEVLSIYLTPEEILAEKIYQCTFGDCFATLYNIANLQMHLQRHHKIPAEKLQSLINGDKIRRKHFYCPHVGCTYHQTAANSPDGTRFFRSSQLLKQHYLKVHGERNFGCDVCGKAFATLSFLRHHHRSCGRKFTCEHCSYSYGSREALLTHAKRKQHGYEQLLLEKKSLSGKRTKQARSKLKTTGTQTVPEPAGNGNCHTSLDLLKPAVEVRESMHSLPDLPCPQRRTMQTQSQTIAIDTTDPITPVVCTETQTDFIDVMFSIPDNRHDPLLSYSHTYTQTSEEPGLSTDLGLSTIETQTSWNDGGETFGDYLVSTETQTNFDIDSFDCASNSNGDKVEQVSCKQTQVPETIGTDFGASNDTGFLSDIDDTIDDHPAGHTQSS